MMKVIDTHCHIDVADFDPDRDQVLADCREQGVSKIVVPAIAADGWDNLLRVCRQQPGLYPALGLHPVFLEQHTDADLQLLGRMLTENSDVVAVGEIGLDFYLVDLDQVRQAELFEAQLDIARAHDLPVILHVRKAHQQTLAILKRAGVKGGIVHAFNGSLEQAREYLALGFKLGFGGMLSYEKSTRLQRLARELPLSAMVMETDAPDMAGAAYRGQRNSPQYLSQYLHALAMLREESDEMIAAATTANAAAILNLHD